MLKQSLPAGRRCRLELDYAVDPACYRLESGRLAFGFFMCDVKKGGAQGRWLLERYAPANFEFDQLNAEDGAPVSRTYPRQLTDLFQGVCASTRNTFCKAHAALCGADSPLIGLTGRVTDVTGPDDPKFRRLIAQMTVNLLPPSNPDRRDNDPDRGGDWL